MLKNHILDPRVLDLQYRTVSLDPIQLHLSPLQPSPPVTLAPMDLDTEEPDVEIDDSEPQLDQDTPIPNNDPADIPTQTL